MTDYAPIRPIKPGWRERRRLKKATAADQRQAERRLATWRREDKHERVISMGGVHQTLAHPAGPCPGHSAQEEANECPYKHSEYAWVGAAADLAREQAAAEMEAEWAVDETNARPAPADEFDSVEYVRRGEYAESLACDATRNGGPTLDVTPEGIARRRRHDALRNADRSVPTQTLYRYFDASGRLLYVGITQRGHRRSQEHAETASWWPKVASQTLEHFDTHAEVEAAEKKAIHTEKPIYNIVGR